MDFGNVSEKTKKGYEQRINRLNRDGFDFDSTLENTKGFLASYDTQTALDLLNIILVLKRNSGIDVNAYRNYRDELNRRMNIERKQRLQSKKIMKIPFFLQQLQKLFDEGQWYRYVLNYLCFHLGVRNEDLDFSFKDSGTGNTLVFKNNVVVYTRRKYKTVKTYGVQQHVIKDPQFIEAYLNIDPSKIKIPAQIGSYLKVRLLQSESDMFKAHIQFLEEKGDTERIRDLAETRGTNVSTVLSHYNLNTEKYVIS